MVLRLGLGGGLRKPAKGMNDTSRELSRVWQILTLAEYKSERIGQQRSISLRISVSKEATHSEAVSAEKDLQKRREMPI